MHFIYSVDQKDTDVRLKIISDQHMEFRTRDNKIAEYLLAYHKPTDCPDCDVCVLAGDFDVIQGRTFTILKDLCRREERVLYVPGNHDYYGCKDMQNTDDALHEIEKAIANFAVLRTGETMTIMGRRFLGDTMWVPDTPGFQIARKFINDYAQIPDIMNEAPRRHQEFLDWLKQEMTTEDIVVTHHLPSERSTPKAFLGTVLQPWFVSYEMENYLANGTAPAVWIHGHTHGSCDYVWGSMRVICNPLGYPSDRSSHLSQTIWEF